MSAVQMLCDKNSNNCTVSMSCTWIQRTLQVHSRHHQGLRTKENEEAGGRREEDQTRSCLGLQPDSQMRTRWSGSGNAEWRGEPSGNTASRRVAFVTACRCG